MAATVVFLGGAGLPAWIWDDARASLAAPSIVPDYPRENARLDDYASRVREQLPDGDLVLVAHSIGGVLAGRLLAFVPDRVTGVLAVSAVIPRPGGSFASSLPFPQRLLVPAMVTFAGTKPPESALRKSYSPGLDEATVDRLVADFDPESKHLYTGRTGIAQWPAHAGYVLTMKDELPVSAQRRYAKELGVATPVTIDSAHLPMLSHPTEFNEALKGFLDKSAG